jgi:hypothetical protein
MNLLTGLAVISIFSPAKASLPNLAPTDAEPGPPSVITVRLYEGLGVSGPPAGGFPPPIALFRISSSDDPNGQEEKMKREKRKIKKARQALLGSIFTFLISHSSFLICYNYTTNRKKNQKFFTGDKGNAAFN